MAEIKPVHIPVLPAEIIGEKYCTDDSFRGCVENKMCDSRTEFEILTAGP
jgi:hypothetical protein